MAYSETTRARYQTDLDGLRDSGLFKEERYIHAPRMRRLRSSFPLGLRSKESSTCAPTTIWGCRVIPM